MMIIQFIKSDTTGKFCVDVVARMKITRRNRHLLDVIKDGSYLDCLGRTYKVVHTSTTIAIRNTGLNTDIFNVYISDNFEGEHFYPLTNYPIDSIIKECKDYLEK